jgi:hypothetical protein
MEDEELTEIWKEERERNKERDRKHAYLKRG